MIDSKTIYDPSDVIKYDLTLLPDVYEKYKIIFK